MDSCLLPYESNKLADAMAVNTLDFHFVGADTGTTGKVYSLLAPQSAASSKVFLAIGGTSDATTAVMTSAVANAMVLPEAQQASQIPMNLINTTESSKLAIGLVSYFSTLEINDPSLADKYAIGFCVQGVDASQVVSVELIIEDASAMSKVVVVAAGSAQIIPEPITLGSNNKINDAAVAEIALTTDPLNIALKNTLIFGALKLSSGLSSLVIAAEDILILRIKVKV